MQDSAALNELDLAIFHAIERSPRASWTTIAAATGVDPATVARRWHAIVDAGIAWVTCYPLLTRNTTSALVEVTCRVDTVRQVAATVGRDPHAHFVEIVSGGSDILITVVSMSQAALGRYVLERLPAIPGVQQVSTQPIVSVHFEGGYGAAGSLEPSSLAMLPTPEHGTLVRSNSTVDDLDWDLCLALSVNGRASFSSLAHATGSSESTIKRRLARLAAEGTLRMMVELAPGVAGNNAVVWLGTQVPPTGLQAAVRGLSQLSGIVAIASVAGPNNLVVKVTLPHLAALERVESKLTDISPQLRIADRKVVLQPVRLMSRLLNEQGRATEAVSIDVRER